MGKLINGIFSSFEGEVGPVVAPPGKAYPILNSTYKKRPKKVSEKELANRNKFAMVQAWSKPLLPFVRVGFEGYSKTVEGYLQVVCIL